MKKTLGGDRLGSGKRMEVDLHNYGRSTHDLGYIWRSTMSAGTLVPFLSELALPGDTFDINLDIDVKTHPTVGPLFGSYKVQLDLFLAPIRLYQGKLHNNKLGIGMKMADVKLPVMELRPNIMTNDGSSGVQVGDINIAQINPSCILAYLGLRGIGLRAPLVDPPVNRTFNAVPFLAYWEIYKNYYANKQEEIGAVIHTVVAAVNQDVTQIEIDGAVISESPTPPSGMPVMGYGSAMGITYTGGTGNIDWNQVIIRMNTGYEITAAQFGPIFSDDGTQASFQYDAATNGIGFWVLDWRYGTGGGEPSAEIDVVTFDLENIDKMREAILSYATLGIPFTLAPSNAAVLPPYSYITTPGTDGGNQSIQNSQEGLALKTYQSDLFNNWLSTEWIDGTGGISEVTAIDTSGGSFRLDTLNLSKKVYDMLNRIAVSGGSYDDWMDAVYTHERYTRCESPMYMGGLIKELVFQEVVSNTEGPATGENGGGGQPLGTLAGKGVMGKKHKGGGATIRVDEPSYIIGIVSLTPRIDYSQGNKWDMHLKTMDDLHKPALDEIGFQELLTEQMVWWDTFQDNSGVWGANLNSVGKQPAWINYMTNINKVYGNFAIQDNEMFMTLNRRYEADIDGVSWLIGDLTTYIDPRKYNNIFADTSLDSQNFWAQIAVDITARRKISARLMPNL